MGIDEAGCYDEPADIDHAGCRDALTAGITEERDPLAADADIQDARRSACSIDDGAAAQEQIDSLRPGVAKTGEHAETGREADEKTSRCHVVLS